MQTITTNTTLTNLRFQHLPAFAQHLLTEHLQAFADYQLRQAKELNIPLLKVLDRLPQEQFNQLMLRQAEELLTYLIRNEARLLIDLSVKRWVENQLPLIDQHDIAAEDITLISLVRKRTFLHFAIAHFTDTESLAALITEVDLFVTAHETASSKTYIRLLQNKIDEHLHFINQINNTTPGAIYVFDVEHFKGIYSNGKLKEVLGYDHEDLNHLGPDVFKNVIHPDDQLLTKKNAAQMRHVPDGYIHSYKFRIKKGDAYRWVRLYESVFKRDHQGKVVQTIGIALDVDNEKRVADKLKEREQQLLEAQDIAQIGSFTWYFAEKRLEGTDKLFRILNIEPHSLKPFLDKVHPADLPRLKDCFYEALQSGQFDCEYRYLADSGEKVLWSKAKLTKQEGAPYIMTGTLMDVTERHRILERLRASQQSYRQAEALAHIGNFEVDLQTSQVTMSEELYRIYELPYSEGSIEYGVLTAMRHPDDAPVVAQALETAIKEQQPYDFYFRINTAKGQLKIVRARGETVLSEAGTLVKLIGTIQDVTEKQLLIEKLKHSDYMYKQAEALANMGNFSMNVQTGEIEWTDQLFIIYGLAPQSEKITLERFYSFIHPEDRAHVSRSIDDFYIQGIADYTFRIITADGTVKVLRSIAQLQKDNNGRDLYVYGTEQDITEHTQLINRLEKSEWLNKQAQAIARLGNWNYNVKTGETTWSDELYRIYELPLTEQPSFELFASFIHPDDKEEVIAYYQKCLQEKTPYDKKHRIVLRNGTIKTLHRKGQLKLDASGELVEFFGTTQDITEQQEKENELREQQHFIQKIADASPTILYLFNVAENSIAYINREVFYVLGYTAEEIIEAGTNLTQLIYHPEDFHLLPERRESARRFSHSDAMIQYECRMKNKDGEWCWVLVREVMFKAGEEGQVVQILGAALDITKRKEMEKTLLQNAFQLEQSNASLEEFAYVASHDLKEPLRKISTFGDRLLHTQIQHLTDDGKTYLKKIVEASQRMQLMINDLLSISMITGDRSFEPYSLQAVLDDVLQTLEYKVEQKAAIINADALPTAHIIPSQFRQLFQNLLSNSLKFVRDDVQPVISITHTFLLPHEVAHLQLPRADAYLQLQFSDNGIGFDEEYAGKIFAIFQRLHGRSEYEGTGIGLAICKKIIEHHRGVIFASGQRNKGATFTMVIPA